MPLLQCPVCQSHLTVTVNAPTRLTCPRCLSPLVNTLAAEALSPQRVLPVEAQISHDNTLLRGVLALIAVAAFVGTLAEIDDNPGLAVTFILLSASTLIVMFTVMPAKIPVQIREVAEGSTYGDGSVLSYRSRVSARSDSTSLGAFVAGFLISIVVCAVCFVILAATAEGGGKTAHVVWFLLVVGIMIGFITGASRVSYRWRGFGLGTTVGMCLGMLAVGPCAFCYLIFAVAG
jgi:hypothetical protein